MMEFIDDETPLTPEEERAEAWEYWHQRALKLEQELHTIRSRRPRVSDNDKDEITVSFKGKELRGWSYSNDHERRQKMLQAREYVEGWCDGHSS